MSKDQPLVSIVMNCYNGDRFLKDAIDSIYRQNYKNWEIIFWDNASTDNSANIARSYDSKIKYYLAVETTSLGEARNLALKKASGKYVAFLDCDDKYLLGKVGYQVQLMECTECALCYGSVIVIDENGSRVRSNSVTDKCGHLLNDLLLMYEINMQSVMIRRSILVMHDFSFDASLRFSPDYDLFMRIAVSHNLCSINKNLVEYRKSMDSLTSKLLDYIAPEMKYTIDSIRELATPSLEINNGISHALRMVEFYKSLPLIKSGNYKKARGFILKSLKARKVFFLYYVILFFPVPPKWVLKIIMR